MATSGSRERANVATCSRVEDEQEKTASAEEEEEELDRLLAVECLGNLLSDRPPREPERTYNEKDFEYHRRTSLHIHHPLSTRLPPHMCFRRKAVHSERRRRRKKKKTSVPPSEVTPTIQEVDEEEAGGSEGDAQDKELSASEEMSDSPKFRLASLESMESLLSEEQLPEPLESPSARTASCPKASSDVSPNSHAKRNSLNRTASGQRTCYDLRERVCIGSMTALGAAVYQKVPTDEAEAQMLATVDLEHMKIERENMDWSLTSWNWINRPGDKYPEQCVYPRAARNRLSPLVHSRCDTSGSASPSHAVKPQLALSPSMLPLVPDAQATTSSGFKMMVIEEDDETKAPAADAFEPIGNEDFEEFALDFEDYDLWESISSCLYNNGEASCHRFGDNPGVRRHLVKKPSRSQITKISSKMPLPSAKKSQLDRKPHEVFVELNELVVDKNNEMTWQEMARWIKFEEDVESETDRWGKPHVASLTFRSLLELRKTIAQGAVLLDLEQKTLPGIAHLVVETMIITDQIKAEDRAYVLRALLVKHSHPNDGKEGGFFPRSGSSSVSSVLLGHHTPHENKSPNGEESVEPQVPVTVEPEVQNQKQAAHIERHKSRSELKLLKQIPDNAEATVVLVGTLAFLEQPTMAFVRLSESVLLESVLEVSVPVRFLFVLLGPPQCSMDYHEIGRSVSTLMSDKDFNEAAYLADDRQDLLNAINEFLDFSIVIPPLELEGKDLLRSVTTFQKEMLRKRREREQKKTMKKEESLLDIKDLCREVRGHEEDDPLERTHLLFGGLIRDIKRRYPKYLSDIRDAFNCQCLAATIFIYFAALSPAITFGGLLGTKTEGMIGVSELIVSTSAMGIFFSLLGAQPLLVIGFTGPLLVFEEAFYNFSKNQNIDYLTGRVWIGFWLVFIVLITVAFEGSLLVRYIYLFTQEIFAFLISAIFIYETLKNLYVVFSEHPLLKTYPPISEAAANYTRELMVQMQPNTALLSLVLMVSTFLMAYFLRKFRNSRFLGGSVRRIIGDFGVPIAILVMLIVDTSVPDTYTEKLNVPLHFSVTSPSKRSWFIHPLGANNNFPLWMIIGAVIPALLLFILIFMETNITTLIVSKKERCLVKGSGFHLDLLLIGLGGGFCGIFGLPWQTAATVRTIAHVNALTVMSNSTAPGEKVRIEEVKEQRITGIVVAMLVGLSVVMSTILRLIPMAVLFGIFLYMGVTSLTGIQLYERLLLMFIPSKLHPDHVYVTKVRTWKMHLFTCIQLICIIALWTIKSTIVSLAFPFFLILTVPTRHFLFPKIFHEGELRALDSDEVHPNFDEDGHDEYSEMHMPL